MRIDYDEYEALKKRLRDEVKDETRAHMHKMEDMLRAMHAQMQGIKEERRQEVCEKTASLAEFEKYYLSVSLSPVDPFSASSTMLWTPFPALPARGGASTTTSVRVHLIRRT